LNSAERDGHGNLKFLKIIKVIKTNVKEYGAPARTTSNEEPSRGHCGMLPAARYTYVPCCFSVYFVQWKPRTAPELFIIWRFANG